MKLPFSYRRRFFSPILFASVAGHALLFVGAGRWTSAPEYAVEQAPSSVEVVLLQEPPIDAPKPEPEQVAVAKDTPSDDHTIVEKKEEPIHEPQPFTPLISPPLKGAVHESKPDYLRNPAPPYPQLAKQRGWEGVVILKVLVENDGRVGDISVERSSGYPILDESALKTVQGWRFLPARLGRLTLASWVRVPVRFRLVD